MFGRLKHYLRTVDDYTENYYCLYRMNPQKPVNAPEAARKIASEALLGERRELVIVHNGREYRLRVTQNGKLILTA